MELEHLKLAFSVSIARAIIDADRKTEYGEFRLFGQIFPRLQLREQGLLDDEDQFTEQLAISWLEAAERLPSALADDEKLDMLTLFYGTSLSDGEVDAREMQVILEAGRILGITEAQFTAHITA